MKSRISGKEAVYVARESERRRPVKLLASDRADGVSVDPLPSETADEGRKAPPRVPKRSRFHDQAWHLRPIWRATEHAYVKPSANSCRMSSSTCEGQFGTEIGWQCCEQ